MFIVFASMSYEHAGGMLDCKGVYPTLDAAIASQAFVLDDWQYYWADIYEVRADGLWSVWSNGALEGPQHTHPLQATP